MLATPRRRAPTWQDTLHQAILLSAPEIEDKVFGGDGVPVSWLIRLLYPAVLAKFPHAKWGAICAIADQEESPRKICWSELISIDGELFDCGGQMTKTRLDQFTERAKGFMDVGEVSVEPFKEGPAPAQDPKEVAKAKRIFNRHLASLDAIALSVSTRGVSRLASKRRF